MLHEPKFWVTVLFFVDLVAGGMAMRWPDRRNLGGAMIVTGIIGLLGIFFFWPESKGEETATPTANRGVITSAQSGGVNIGTQINNYVPNITASPEPPNKYVCMTQITPFTKVKYAVLVEFGVSQRDTDGVIALVQTTGKYSRAINWRGAPLRTDYPANYGEVSTFKIDDTSNPNIYKVRFSSPNLTPRNSLYLYLEGNEPLFIHNYAFVEEYSARSDQTRLEALIAEPIGKCPR